MFRRYFINTCSFLLLLAAISGCANYQPHFGGDVNYQLPNDTITYSSFFVGDLGYEPSKGRLTLAAIQYEMERTLNKKSLLLLGDITGKHGFQKSVPGSVEQLKGFVHILEQIEGKVFLTPGENELGNNGYFSRLKELEAYLKTHCKKKIKFMPNKACSGPDDTEIYDGIGLIGLNTAWYLAPWHKESEVSEGCDFNDRHDFLFAAADEIKSYRDKVKIVMLHHPLQSNGNRGGHYALMQHLFPLTDIVPGAYVPLPVVGSIFRTLQGVGGGKQDLTSLRYKHLIRQLKARTEDEDNIIFLSAHEHNMLYVDGGNHHVITAGSGSDKGPAVGGKKADFAYGAIGFGRLDFMQNGAVYLRFFTVDPMGKAHEAFSRKIIENRFEAASPDLPPVLNEQTQEQTVKTPVYSSNNAKRSGIYNGLFGTHYRDLYSMKVKVPVLYIDTLHGGLTPYRRGGGQSTQSLHTKGGDGHLYQLRSVRKNPAQMLPDILERSFAADLARDQFTAIHPYAPLTLPRMQRELGLLGASPGLYFVPKQKQLGNYNSSFGGEMYYLEQRADEDWSGTGFYANSENIISNNRVREEMADDWKHRADQKAYLMARLFDFWIGDWDRHRDQWRWAEIDQPDGFKTYLPIARDRDQVYSNFDGTLLKLAGIIIPEARKLQRFDYKMGKVRWRSLNGKWNDRFFLNELNLKDFEVAAQTLMSKMTDEVIDEAMQAFPKEVYNYSTEKEDIDGKLKKRREQILDFARSYYKHLAKTVTITASDKDDVLEASSTPEGGLIVKVYDADKRGNADEKYYERTFFYPETKEVRLYGLDGNDLFQLSGTQKSNIRLRIIGGTDVDELAATGKLAATIHDSKTGMEFDRRTPKIRDRRSDRHPELNQYQFQEYKQDYSIPFPSFGYNVDDGLFFGLGVTIRRHGFRPNPYATNHFISGSYSSNGTMKFDYDGTYNNTFGRQKDFLLEVDYRSPDFVVNFFGLGNETVQADSENLEFNRSRQERRLLSTKLRLRGKDSRTAFTIGPYYQSFKVDRGDVNSNLISQPGVVNERVFNRQEFAGLKADFQLNNLAYPAIPDNGIKLKMGLEKTFNLNDSKRNFYRYGGHFTYYQFFGKQIFGVASRVGYESIVGEFEFYQAAQLGGRTNFRAVRSERFLGNTVFYHNTDIRVRGIGFGKKATTATAGFLLGFDYGRVWLKNEENGVPPSKVWHYAYGGGLWVAPANVLVISATYFANKTENRVNIGAGFPF